MRTDVNESFFRILKFRVLTFYLQRDFATKNNTSKLLLEWLGKIIPMYDSLHIERVKLYDLRERNTD